VQKITDPQDKEELVAIEDLDGLIALVQASVLEIHPWGARQDDLDHPDQLTFDLDPGENVPWSALVAGAVEVHARLTQRKLKSFVKTSGGKGLHVVVPLTPKADWETAKAFCQSIAVDMAKDAPDLYTATMAKRARDGRIYIDYLRNGRGATAVAAYSPRARANAGVSTPLTWDELESSISGEHFTLLNIGKRLSHLARDPWAGFHAVQQELPEPRTRGKRR
jgi:bifunctional non-homologous end joining protein LigD